MPRRPRIPPELARLPFRATRAINSGLITRSMLAGAQWRRLFPDVYAHQDINLDHRAWCAAVSLTLRPEVAIGGPSAAHLWGATTPHTAVPVHVVTPRILRLEHDKRIEVHYTTLTPGDLTSLDGLRLTTPERTIFDLGRRADRVEALITLDAMLHRDLLSPEKLRQMMRERSRWPGTAKLTRLLPLADRRSESPMETRLRLLLTEAGIGPAAVQFEARNSRGELIARVDLAWPKARLAAEYDGDHHRTPPQFRQDLDRLNRLHLAGWTVLRFTADDVFQRPTETARIVIATLSELTRTPSSRPH